VGALRRYAPVWRIPGAPVLLIFGLIARLSMSMTPLGLLLLVQQATGRYTPAALAGAVYALAFAGVAPIVGRVADRIGPAPVLLFGAGVQPLALIGVVLAARGERPNLVAIVLTAGFAGMTYPPLVATLRGAWSRLTEPGSAHASLRDTGLAAETVLFQCVFIVGPLLVTGLVAVGSPTLVILGSAVATGLGTATLARGRALRQWRPDPTAVAVIGLGPLRLLGFPALLTGAAALGFACGTATVGLPAFATGHGSDSGALAGVLFSILGVGSVLGGILFGSRVWRAAPARMFAILLGAVAASYVAFGLMPYAIGFMVVLFVGGLPVAPVLTVQNALVGRITPIGMRTEAYTWAITVEATATAIGIQVAGLIVDRPGGLLWAFVLAGAVLGVTGLVTARPAGSLFRGSATGVVAVQRSP
jgi:MFS family permease